MSNEIDRRRFLKGAALFTSSFALESCDSVRAEGYRDSIDTTKNSSENPLLEINVDFEPKEDESLELIWIKEGQHPAEHPDENIVNWYEFIGEVSYPIEEVRSKYKIVGEGHPKYGITFQSIEIKGDEKTLVWVKRYESERGDVPYRDDRMLPFYTRPGDFKGTPAGMWRNIKE